MKNKAWQSGLVVLAALAVSMLNIQCRKYSSIEDKLAIMKSQPVVVDWEEYKVLFEPEGWSERYKQRKTPFFVMYVDSAHCSSCKMSNMPYWEDYRKKVQSRYPDVGFVVIYEPSSAGEINLVDYVDTLSFRIPVLVDSKHCFRRNNHQIPDEDIYHDFLLDERGNVLVIGSPMSNAGIEKLFFQMLDSIQRKR